VRHLARSLSKTSHFPIVKTGLPKRLKLSSLHIDNPSTILASKRFQISRHLAAQGLAAIYMKTISDGATTAQTAKYKLHAAQQKLI
jgi:hypothetical protein